MIPAFQGTGRHLTWAYYSTLDQKCYVYNVDSETPSEISGNCNVFLSVNFDYTFIVNGERHFVTDVICVTSRQLKASHRWRVCNYVINTIMQKLVTNKMLQKLQK